jgi:hypothetical protein
MMLFVSAFLAYPSIAIECSLDWSESQTVSWVKTLGADASAYAPAFRKHKVDGQALTTLDEGSLVDMGIK